MPRVPCAEQLEARGVARSGAGRGGGAAHTKMFIPLARAGCLFSTILERGKRSTV